MDISTILGFLIAFCLTVIAIVMGSKPEIYMNFIDGPSLLFVIGGTFGLSLVSFSFSQVLGIFGSLKYIFFRSNHKTKKDFSDKNNFMHYIKASKKELSKGIEVYKKIPYLAIAAGVIGSMIGEIKLLHIFQTLTNVESAFAVSMLTLLYSIFLAFFICLPIRYKLEQRLLELQWLESEKFE